MSALVRPAKGKPDSILMSENRKSFDSDVLSYENELIGESGIDTSNYPTREPESEHKQQHLNKP